MSDYLLNLSTQPFTRSLVRGLGLPTPQALARAPGLAYQEQALLDRVLVLGGGGPAHPHLYAALRVAGAKVDPASPTQTLIYDASGAKTLADLQAVYEFFHEQVPKLAANARVVILSSCPEEAAESEQAAVARALEGFTRSLAKEIGRRGANANLLIVEAGAEPRIEGPLNFFGSPRCAYVDGQALRVSALARPAAQLSLSAPLKNKVALVTGAARGIGAATAQRLAEEGAHVICVDLPSEELEATAVAIGGTAHADDLTLDEAPERIARLIESRHGGLDVLVHNAGVTRDKTIAKMDARRWQDCLAVNLGAVMRLDRMLDQRALMNDGGRVVCLSSIAGIAGNVGQTNYASAKAGIIGYVGAQARRLAPRGICVNAIAPGYIETRMMLAVPFFFREFARRANSLSQGGVPLDAAELITFLCTPGAHGVTGQTVRVCGQNLLGA